MFEREWMEGKRFKKETMEKNRTNTDWRIDRI